jgi:hypothetical protein
MVNVIRSIDVVSPADGKRYSSTREYDRSLERMDKQVMSDRSYKELREKIIDESKSAPQPREEINHIHIDIANGRIIKSKKDLNV